MAKKIMRDTHMWNIYLNMTLAAIRFHTNESFKFSPYYLLYNRDEVLTLEVARVAQWLERRRKDLVIIASLVRIPLWDVGAGPSDETV
jgi:hypothetical protein